LLPMRRCWASEPEALERAGAGSRGGFATPWLPHEPRGRGAVVVAGAGDSSDPVADAEALKITHRIVRVRRQMREGVCGCSDIGEGGAARF
jgi:hypothetical protein